MIGPRVGLRVGGRRGPAVGLGIDELGTSVDPFAAFRDASSAKACPTSLAQWALMTSKVPSHTWGFQDAAGNIAATVGTALTVANAPTYQATVTGWTRKALRFNTTVNQRAAFAAAAGPNPATGSVAWFGLIDPTATPATTGILMFATDGTPILNTRINSTPRIGVNCNGVIATGSNDPVTGGVRPVLLVYNKTATTVKAYTDQEIVAGTYNAGVVDGNKGYGAVGTPCAMDVLLGAAFQGADAEFTDSDARNLFRNIGYSIGW